MKKTFSKAELEAKASTVFEQYPTAEQVFATVDGNIFLHKNRAELHSKDTIYTFDRPVKGVSAEPKAEKPKAPEAPKKDANNKTPERISAADAIKGIEEAKTLAELEPFAKDKRAAVKAAYDTKKEALTKELEVKQ